MAVSYSSYTLEIDTGWFSFAGFGGYQRFYELLLLGQAITEHALRIKTAYDFDPRWTDDQLFYASELGQYFDSSALYAMSSAVAYADKAYLLSVATSRGKCTAIRFNISDYSPGGLSTINFDGTTDTELLALYKLNESVDSANATDSSGHGYTLTSYSDPPVGVGKFGGCRSFPPTGCRWFWRSDAFAASPFSPAQLTVCGWVTYTGSGSARTGGIVFIKDSSVADPSVYVYIEAIGAVNLVKFQLLLAGGATINLASTSSVGPTTWVHFAVTYSGQTANLYINGVLEATQTLLAPTAINYNKVANTNLYVGVDYRNAGRYLMGSLDDLAFYNAVKSASWIAATAKMPPDAANSFSLSGMSFCIGNKRQLANAGDARKV